MTSRAIQRFTREGIAFSMERYLPAKQGEGGSHVSSVLSSGWCQRCSSLCRTLFLNRFRGAVAKKLDPLSDRSSPSDLRSWL